MLTGWENSHEHPAEGLELVQCDQLKHTLQSHPTAPASSTAPDCHAMLQRRVGPTTSRDLSYSEQIASTPDA